MRIGYPCLNHSIAIKSCRTFRLASYSDERFIETVAHNLHYVQAVLEYNAAHGFKFFRIGSSIVPFASHPVLKVDWQKRFAFQLRQIGEFVRSQDMRISMHPDQFTLINSPKKEIVQASVRELLWQAQFMELLGLDHSAKLQIHVGGVYGDRAAAIRAFIANYVHLPEEIKDRLVIENDDRSFGISDCMKIHEAVGIPIVFDNFHHACFNYGETLFEAIVSAYWTWSKKDGPLMVDYSSQQAGAVRGAHAQTIELKDFRRFINSTSKLDFDVMLEIKDKEKSALKALAEIQKLNQPNKQEVMQ